MRTTKTLTVSLPPAMLVEFEFIKKSEKRTGSELVREALRQYFYSKFPVYTPTKAEAKAIKKGREEIKRGEYVTLDELIHELDSRRNKAGKKRHRKASLKGSAKN